MTNNEIKFKMKEINHLIRKRWFKKAEEAINELEEKMEKVEIDEKGRVYDFSTRLEFLVFYQQNNNNTKISWKRNHMTELYLEKAFLCYARKKYKEAIKELNNALRWNPSSSFVYLELLENYTALNDEKEFKKYFKKAQNVILEPEDLAELYIKHAYFSLNQKKFELAYNLFKYAFLLCPIEENEQKIAELEEIIGIPLKRIPDIGTIKYIRENGLEYKPSDIILDTYSAAIFLEEKELEELTDPEEILYTYEDTIHYYQNLYMLNPDEEIHLQMVQWIEKYNELKETED